jgi:protein-tyrosine phosphatase
MSESFARRIELDGAVNFRDIGGYPAANGRRIRWRRIFRADNLGDLTPADHVVIDALAIRTLIDFRLPSERAALPNRLAPAHAIKTVEIGFVPHGTLDLLRAVSRGTAGTADIERAFVDQYRRFVTDHSTEFARALSYALDAEHLPLLLHCTSGKDRTGFAISVLLLALGTPRETIASDYELTNSYRRDISRFFSAGAPDELKSAVMAARPQYLAAAFDQMVASYGSIDAYLERALGLGDEQRRRLAELLTEPA